VQTNLIDLNEKYKIRKIREGIPSIPALLEGLRKNLSDDDDIGNHL